MGNISQIIRAPLLRLVAINVTLSGAAMATIGPLLSIIGVERLAIADNSYALVMAISAVASVFATLGTGIMTDQTGKRRAILAAGLAVSLVALTAMSVFPSAPLFMFVHMVALPIGGTAFAQLFALGRLGAKAVPGVDDNQTMATIRAGFSAAFVLTPVLWSLALADGVSVMTVYPVSAFLHLVMLVQVLFFWPRNTDETVGARSGISFIAALGELADPAVVSRVLMISLIVGSNGLSNIILGLVIINAAGGTAASVGWVAGAIALVEIPVMLLIGVMLRHASKTTLLALSALIYMVYLVGLSQAQSLAAIYWTILPAGIGLGIMLGLKIAYVQDLLADRPGAGSALDSVVFFIGTGIASVLFAVGTSHTDYSGTALYGAVAALVGGAGLYALDRFNWLPVKTSRQPLA